jgi:predicted transcriptional regulator
MTARRTSQHTLTPLQQAILDFIWSRKQATSEEIRMALLPRHPLKDSSVRTILRRLEDRGLLTHRMEGKVFIYRAKMPAQSMAARAVRHIIEKFCAGSAEQFLTGLVDENVLSAGEIQRLARKVRKNS